MERSVKSVYMLQGACKCAYMTAWAKCFWVLWCYARLQLSVPWSWPSKLGNSVTDAYIEEAHPDKLGILPMRKLIHENLAYEPALGEWRLPHKWERQFHTTKGGGPQDCRLLPIPQSETPELAAAIWGTTGSLATCLGTMRLLPLRTFSQTLSPLVFPKQISPGPSTNICFPFEAWERHTRLLRTSPKSRQEIASWKRTAESLNLCSRASQPGAWILMGAILDTDF